MAVDTSMADAVSVGSTVTVRDLREPAGGPEVWKIVADTDRPDPLAGQISELSPIARAVLGRRAGDRVRVVIPGVGFARQVEILEVAGVTQSGRPRFVLISDPLQLPEDPQPHALPAGVSGAKGKDALCGWERPPEGWSVRGMTVRLQPIGCDECRAAAAEVLGKWEPDGEDEGASADGGALDRTA
jgi:hypothetical protein